MRMTAPHAPAALRSGAWLRRKILPNLNGNMNDCGFLGAKIQIILLKICRVQVNFVILVPKCLSTLNETAGNCFYELM